MLCHAILYQALFFSISSYLSSLPLLLPLFSSPLSHLISSSILSFNSSFFLLSVLFRCLVVLGQDAAAAVKGTCTNRYSTTQPLRTLHFKLLFFYILKSLLFNRDNFKILLSSCLTIRLFLTKIIPLIIVVTFTLLT